MYFGSVKFFKHLIVLTVVVAFLVLLTVIICLSVQNRGLRTDFNHLRQEFNELSEAYSMIVNVRDDGNKTGGSDQNSVGSENSFDPELPEYQQKYPELYAKDPLEKAEYIDDKGACYLTFDHSPSKNTMDILDILDEKNVKATFFVSKTDVENAEGILKEIVDRGHAIGLQCYDEDYDKIYSSVDSYLYDLFKIYDMVYKATGVKSEIIRFPEGSVNTYNSRIYREIIAEILRRGFVYSDWNISTVTSSAVNSPENMLGHIKNNAEFHDRLLILSDDTDESENLVSALPQIIDFLMEKEYTFSVLSKDVKPIVFGYKN